jgi:ferredoxin--NADP+ reductase
MPNWCHGVVTKKQVWSEGLFTVTVKADGVQPFVPGQFLHLALPDADDPGTAEEPNRINRPYSVASPFGDELEFFIVKVEDGQLTPPLWTLDAGDKVEVSDKAAGSFTLNKAPDAEILWLIATGTGLAPYVAMLRTDHPWSSYEKIVLVHGVRHHHDLAYTDELKWFEKKFRGRFKFVQTLTRDSHAGCMNGRIPALFDDGQIEKQVGWKCTAESSTVMLCGNPAMLDSMEESLGRRKMKKHRSKSPGQIVLERYW